MSNEHAFADSLICDQDRLEALRRYNVLDTEPEPAFDRLTRLAARFLDAPTALINFVTDERQWFKSTVGFEKNDAELEGLPCAHTVEQGEVVVIEDLTTDDRFANTSYVTEHGVRFYVGAPLTVPSGACLGTLCVLDTEPRFPSEETLASLSDLAALVVDELELRKEKADHRQTRRDLAESQTRLQHTQQLANVGSWTYDPQADTTTCTEQMYRIHDLPPDADLKVDDALRFCTEESRPVFEAHFQRLLEEGGRYDLELSIETAEGRRRQVRALGEAQRVDGETIRIDGAVQDITEHHRTRQELAEQEETLQAVLDHAPVMIAHTKNGELKMINDQAKSVLGWSDEELDAPADLLERCYPDPEVRKDVMTAIKEAPDEWRNYRTRRADGTRIDTTWKNVSLGNGKRIGFGLDISDQKNRERALADANRRLRLALEAADAGTFEHDLATDQIRLDERALDQYGLPPEPSVRSFSVMEDLVVDEDRSFLLDTFDRIVENEERYDISFRIQRADDGEVRWIRSHGRVVRNASGTAERIVGVNRDITERKEREMALQRQKALLEQTQRLAGAWEVDLRTEEMSWSEAVYRIHEVEPGTEISLDDGIQFYAPKARPEIRAAFEACMLEGAPYDLELPIDTAEGNRRWVRTVGAPVQEEDGDIVKVAGAFQDITDRKEAERELRQSRERLQMAVEGGNIGTWDWDLDTGKVLFNRQWAEMLGYSRDELNSHFSTWAVLVHPDDLTRATNMLERYLDGEIDTYNLEIRMRTKAGEWKWIQTIGKVIKRDEDGNATRAAGIHLDISERKAREKRLRILSEAVEQANESILITEAFSRNETGPRIVYANEAFEEMTGYAEEEILGEPPRLLQGPKTSRAVLDDIYAALENGTPWEGETTHYRKDGTPYRQEWNLAPVRDESGSIQYWVSTLRDVTEERKREATLRRQKSLLEQTQRLAGAWEVDLQTEEMSWSEEIYRIHEVEFDREISVDEGIQFYAPEARPKIRAAFEACVSEGAPYDLELPIETAKGNRRWVHTVGAPAQTENGEVVKVAGAFQDITAQKEAERQLRKERNFLDRILETSPVAIAVLNADGEFLEASNRAEEILGLEKQEVKARTYNDPEWQIRRPDGGPIPDEELPFAQVMATEEPIYDFEHTIEWPDGTNRLLSVSGAPLHSANGDLEGAVFHMDDITEQREAERALERQNDLFAKAQDIADVGAWEYDVRSGETIVTEQACHIHGMTPGAEIGLGQILGLFHPDDQAPLQNAFRRAIKEGTSYDLELRLVPEDGTPRWVRTRGEPQREDGDIVRVRGATQDVTAQVRRREALKEAKEAAEEADRIKTALLSNMNHEFRTPLTSIITFAELIRENPDVAERFADRILGGGKRLLYTLNTVMDFAELEGGGKSATRQETPIGEVVQSVAGGFRERADRKGIALSVQGADAVETALLDEHLLRRTLTHLIHNAVKFTDEGEVTVSVRRQEETVGIVVEDTGMGIDPAFRPRIFDEFAQQSTGPDRTHEGNGLGLTIAKRLTEEMGGTIEIESELGKGTVVTVRLPSDG